MHLELPNTLIIWMVSCIIMIWPIGKNKKFETESHDTQLRSGSCKEYIEWGVQLGLLGKTKDAIEQFKNALEIDYNNAMAHYNLAFALDQLGDITLARHHYIEARKIDISNADIKTNLGADLLLLGDYESAISNLKNAIENDPGNSIAHYNLGCAYLYINKYKDAVTCFREARNLDPKDPQIRLNLAIALRKAGCPDIAEIDLYDFLELAGTQYPEQRKYVEYLIDTEYKDEK